MASIRGLKPADPWELFTRIMWRAALGCVAVSLITTALAQFSGESAASAELLATDLEQVVIAPIIPDETW